MFVGHIGVALAAKPLAPRASLATLVLASSLIDYVWPILLIAGVERVRIAPAENPFLSLQFTSYPVSHSAVLVLVWAAAFAAAYRLGTGSARGAVVAGALVASHWLLDALSHVPDLPLWPGGPKAGLGLWRSEPAAVAIELAIFAAGALVYLFFTRPRDAVGRFALAGWLGLLLAVYVASLFGPPPPNVVAIATANLVGGTLTLVWAAWLDRHRLPREARRGEGMASVS